MMPGGGGSVQQSCETCRMLKTIRMPMNGAKVAPKMAMAISESPITSMQNELRASTRLADFSRSAK